MLGRQDALAVKDALSLLFENLPKRPKEEEEIRLEDSYGRVLSRDIHSPEDLPHFSRSTVDGFAVHAEDTFGAHSYLTVSHEIQMAEEPRFQLKRGFGARIPTGGMLPEGADAVLMFEHAQWLEEKTIEAQKPVSPHENVIEKAEDIRAGELVLNDGHRLRAQDVAVFAGIGIKNVFVYKKPCVSVISSGDEIIPHDSSIKPGFIRDMNSFILDGLIGKEGGIVLKKGIFNDQYNLISSAVHESIKDSKIVLITGGSSVGAGDLTAKVINGMGRIIFHGVSMKPGKPTIAGVIGDTVVFGLPGHPVAVMICFNTFVMPVLRYMSGVKEEGFCNENRVKAKLTKGIHSLAGKLEHIRVSLKAEGEVLFATPQLGKSGLISTLVRADGIITVLPHELGIAEGETVEVKLF
ncbi:MAG: molybdopterin molybdotransferase MoeA [Nitrospirae bacterium]|nr:molybdopterin molybdotransferase MoeA [Nitrospirota bacterium]